MLPPSVPGLKRSLRTQHRACEKTLGGPRETRAPHARLRLHYQRRSPVLPQQVLGLTQSLRTQHRCREKTLE
eukprot:9325-Pelagococcus_subviridis.AAC.1